MKLSILAGGGHSGYGIGSAGGTLTGPLALPSAVTNPMHAITKLYVDTAVSTHVGDSSSHITGEEKTFIDGITVTSSEINRLSGLTGNVKTILNNKLGKTGGTLAGSVNLSRQPVEDMEAGTRLYLTTKGQEETVNVGRLVAMPTEVPAAGYLRCNGARVNKETYADLYAAIGDRYDNSPRIDYIAYHAIGAGRPWEQQYDISSTTSLGDFSSTGTIPASVYHSQVFTTKNRLYLIGAYNATNPIRTIYTAAINEDGTLGAFSTYSVQLPVGLYGSMFVTIKNNVYLMGGVSSSGIVKTIYRASINEDGSLGDFTIIPEVIPVVLRTAVAVVTKNRVYLIGGTSSAPTNAIFTSVINEDGSLGQFVTDTNTLPANVYHSCCVTTKNKVYLIGGHNGTSIFNTIYTANIDSDGRLGVFSLHTGTLPVAMYGTTVFVSNSKVYTFGGCTGDINNPTAITTVYSADISSDGSIGAFTNAGVLPAALGFSKSFATRSRVYTIGGWRASAGVNNIYSAPLVNGQGLNDCSKLYDGSINKFDGSDVSSGITIDPIEHGAIGGGQPWNQQYWFNNAQDFGTITNVGEIARGYYHNEPIIIKNKLYIIGAGRTSDAKGRILRYNIKSDGTVDFSNTYSKEYSFTVPTVDDSYTRIVTKNKIHLICGVIHENNTYSTINNIYTATISPTGEISDFVSSGTFPDSLYSVIPIVTKNYVYILGGDKVINGVYQYANTNIYRAPINTDGTLGTFTNIGTNPVNFTHAKTVVTKNRVYILGLYSVDKMYTAVINPDGTIGNIVADATLPFNMYYGAVAVFKKYVYFLGGITYPSYISMNTIYRARIKDDGTLDPFVLLPKTLDINSAITFTVVTKSMLYLFNALHSDAMNTQTVDSNVYSAPLLGGAGISDNSRLYDGTINKFDGTGVQGFIDIDPSLPGEEFTLPNTANYDALTPNLFTYIRSTK